ncbi:hypothetical protein OPV22_012109 [Ensete ventricosum]|uniref:Secreted protein n=1 Tax=Ensete ventricosum TaxID=4639 RepID=A0AAV8PH59_ENSVE|nr:hypothetical protein OPV22_012109 [Ensete ventricosum]
MRALQQAARFLLWVHKSRLQPQMSPRVGCFSPCRSAHVLLFSRYFISSTQNLGVGLQPCLKFYSFRCALLSVNYVPFCRSSSRPVLAAAASSRFTRTYGEPRRRR